ncbi:hypothetical protein QE152_g7740 [Popillia japonica]|uniref:Leucine zipper tumor suppressor 2 homolog n=1 Tax=Popillia japonica TaxID=7064 RepID=A0AAW1ME06_POPJA
MATVDSGTETLFSDESPCELVGSPSACLGEDAETQVPDLQSETLGPPNIQPYSGVLEKGKEVIRPIAFKPAVLTPAPRFGLSGERYGSTPILTRPGSNDLRQMPGNVHYSLDRKLRSLCPSVSSSPPMQMSSLTSLPHKLMNYDSLESVRKSPVSVVDGSLMNKSSYRLSGAGGGSLLDLTPSPSDSGVSELEAALRDRDSELAYLRQTMEHNEQVIFRVYQEKERVWERELRRLKNVHENRLRTNAQKTLKLEQLLMTQTYQLQQDKKRLYAEAQRANCANCQTERLKQEVCVLRGRLEETEWGLCQKTGEISLLKSQLKDFQSEQTAKGHELLQLKNEYRETRDLLDMCENDITNYKRQCNEKDEEIASLKKQIVNLSVQATDSAENKTISNKQDIDHEEIERLKVEIRELRQELSEVSMSEYEGLESGRIQRTKKVTDKKENDNQKDEEFRRQIESLKTELVDKKKEFEKERLIEEFRRQIESLKTELVDKKKEFEKERLIWAQEKEKVLRYQRQLQMNYVQMYRRTRALEDEVESLTIELELDKTGHKKKLSDSDLTQTIEL